MPPRKNAEGKTDQYSGRNLKATMKKLDAECQLFQSMSQGSVHEAGSDSAAFGLSRLEYQAAKVVAIASVKAAHAQGQIQADDIQNQVHRSTRRIAGDQSFRDWVKEASNTPGKMEQLGRTSPEEVRADFIKRLSEDMNREKEGPVSDALNREGPKARQGIRRTERRTYERKVEEKKIKDPQIKDPKLKEPVMTGP